MEPENLTINMNLTSSRQADANTSSVNNIVAMTRKDAWKAYSGAFKKPENHNISKDLLKQDLMKMLGSLDSSATISLPAKDNLADFLIELIAKTMKEANQLREIHSPGRDFITKTDIETALKLLFDGQCLALLKAKCDHIYENYVTLKSAKSSKE